MSRARGCESSVRGERRQASRKCLHIGIALGCAIGGGAAASREAKSRRPRLRAGRPGARPQPDTRRARRPVPERSAQRPSGARNPSGARARGPCARWSGVSAERRGERHSCARSRAPSCARAERPAPERRTNGPPSGARARSARPMERRLCRAALPGGRAQERRPQQRRNSRVAHSRRRKASPQLPPTEPPSPRRSSSPFGASGRHASRAKVRHSGSRARSGRPDSIDSNI